jgi:glycosyltransferase involved in cell wall biosynthesis
VIPAFNSSKTIGQAVDSVLAQTYQVDQVIIVNNNSTDDLATSIERFGNKISLIECTEQGVSSARNHGVANATSEYIAFLDSDDYWFPTKIEKQVQVISDSNSKNLIFGCYADYLVAGRKIGMSLRSSDDVEALENLRRNGDLPCITSSWVISREAYIQLGGMLTEVMTAEDFEFACRAVTHSFKFKIIREPLVGYSISQGSLTQSNYLKQYYTAQYYFNRYFNQLAVDNLAEYLRTTKTLSKIWRHGMSNRFIRQAIVNYSFQKPIHVAVQLALAFLISPKKATLKLKRQFRWN